MMASLDDREVDCQDILDFQRRLGRMRKAEDKMIFRLNNEFPTNSFSNGARVKFVCDDIEARLSDLRQRRSLLIYRCAKENQQIVNDFRNEPEKFANLRNAHYNLRILKNESLVDEVVVAQTDKLVHERCRKELLGPAGR